MQRNYLLVNKMTGRQRNYIPCNYYWEATKLYTCKYHWEATKLYTCNYYLEATKLYTCNYYLEATKLYQVDPEDPDRGRIEVNN